MNPEILQMKGMLAEAKKKYRSLDTEASGLVILIRNKNISSEKLKPAKKEGFSPLINSTLLKN